MTHESVAVFSFYRIRIMASSQTNMTNAASFTSALCRCAVHTSRWDDQLPALINPFLDTNASNCKHSTNVLLIGIPFLIEGSRTRSMY